MPWWSWIIFGVVMLGSELLGVDAAFYLVFIGAAAILTGLIWLAGLTLEPWVQWLLFAVLSLLAMVFFRKRVYQKMRGGVAVYVSGPVGEFLHLEETLAPGASCRMSYRGAGWTVMNSGAHTIRKGERAQIKTVQGLTLMIDNPD